MQPHPYREERAVARLHYHEKNLITDDDEAVFVRQKWSHLWNR